MSPTPSACRAVRPASAGRVPAEAVAVATTPSSRLQSSRLPGHRVVVELEVEVARARIRPIRDDEMEGIQVRGELIEEPPPIQFTPNTDRPPIASRLRRPHYASRRWSRFESGRRRPTEREGGHVTAPLAADALGAHDEVVEVALLGLRGAIVPVVLQEHGVDAVLAIRSLPVEPIEPSLQTATDP